MLTPNDANCIKSAVEKSPITVAVASSTWHFKLYTGGIIRSSGCGTDVDHALLVVGYGSVDGTTEYIRMKNSWGTKWGADGYVRIEAKYGEEGVCGLNKMPI